MKILHVLPYSPIPPTFGGAIRIYHMLTNLARHHEVTVLTFGSAEDYTNLSECFNSHLKAVHTIPNPWTRKHRRLAQFYALWTDHSFFHLLGSSKEMQREIDQLLSENEYDIVQSEFPSMGSYRFNTDAIKILDAHNVEYDIFRRMWRTTPLSVRKLFYHREYKTNLREEIDVCLKQHAIFVTSARDKAVLDGEVPNVPKFVVPNGVDTSYFKLSAHCSEPSSLVFTGMMAYLPNYDGMLYFLDEIFPLVQKQVPEAKIYIVGNRPPKALLKRASDKVTITGFVDDVRPFVSRATVYVVPLRMGGGTRLKVLEAMAMKKPIVTTSIGCEGIDVTHGESVLIEDDPEGFARALVELLRNANLRRRLIQNSYDLVTSRYEWSVIGQRVEELYRSVALRVKGNTNIVVN